MLGVGFTEVLLIALVALMVLGPRRLPELARTTGALVGRARSAWQSLRQEIDAELDAEHNRRILEEVEKLKGEIQGSGSKNGDG